MEWTLYHYWRSSSSWRVRWALEHKKLSSRVRFQHVDLLDGESEGKEHLARNPLGYVPVLDVGRQNLVETVAILEWLEENFPAPTLYPGDSYERAHLRSLIEVINSDTQPVQSITVLDELSEDPARRKEWNQFFIRRGLSAYQTLAERAAGDFSIGNQVTAADLFLIPQCYNALRFEVNLHEFPLIEKIYQRALLLPEVQASVPERYKPTTL